MNAENDDFGNFRPTSEMPTSKPENMRNEYSVVRNAIIQALNAEGIDDFELYGAGWTKNKEELSPLEYQGALRVVGPENQTMAQKFINIIKSVVAKAGFNVAVGKPPSVTHLFGKTLSKTDIAERRPFLYIYKSYTSTWPLGDDDRRAATSAGISPDEMPYGASTKIYEDRVSQIASDMTDNTTPAESISRQICATKEFKVLREETIDVVNNNGSMKSGIFIPVSVGDYNKMMYVFVESVDGKASVYAIEYPSRVLGDVSEILASIIASSLE